MAKLDRWDFEALREKKKEINTLMEQAIQHLEEPELHDTLRQIADDVMYDDMLRSRSLMSLFYSRSADFWDTMLRKKNKLESLIREESGGLSD